MRERLRAGMCVAGIGAFAGVTACASDAQVPPDRPPPATTIPMTGLAEVTQAALADAARRTGLKREELEVLSAQAVTWPDGSLGCPKPGMMYTQALVPGYRVKIQAGSQLLDYHAGRGGVPAFCPADRVHEPVRDDRN